MQWNFHHGLPEAILVERCQARELMHRGSCAKASDVVTNANRMTERKLVEIRKSGALSEPVDFHSTLDAVIPLAVELYRNRGFHRPWISYVAVENEHPIGTCSFKSLPVDGRVEIAYWTFAENEGVGVGTWMATQLLELAQRRDPTVCVFAQTLPEESASTAILRKIGFSWDRSVEHPDDGIVWEWSVRSALRGGD